MSQQVENKENPPTQPPSQPVETKSMEEVQKTMEQTTSAASSDDSSTDDGQAPVMAPSRPVDDQNGDYYYDAFGRRVIRMGRPVTLRAESVNNRMIVQEDVVRETSLPGTTKVGHVQLFAKGQEVSPSSLKFLGATKVG
jgi:hypothetical protein